MHFKSNQKFGLRALITPSIGRRILGLFCRKLTYQKVIGMTGLNDQVQAGILHVDMLKVGKSALIYRADFIEFDFDGYPATKTTYEIDHGSEISH